VVPLELPPFHPDPAQSLVLDHGSGALLVTGTAGTGKTAVLRERFARLIEGGADPERVALVVASARARDGARRELLRRLRRSLPGLRVTTIHGLAYQLVTARYDVLGYDQPPTVLDAAAQFVLVQELLQTERLEMPGEWRAYGSMLGLRGFADEVRGFVVRAQESLLGPEQILEGAERQGLTGWRDLTGFYQRYLQVLDAQNAVDFGGIVGQASIAAEAGDLALDHVLSDDFQDTTLAAEQLLATLRPATLAVAGDPSAHVFSFQGMTDVPIRRFVDRFGAREVRLTTRHRGAEPAMEAWRFPHASEEHVAVARELRRIHVVEGVPWRDLAMIARRSGAHMAGQLRALDDAGVPRAISGVGLSASAAPTTFPYVLALRWIVASADARDDLVESVLTSELGGVSPASARALLRLARAGGGRPADALRIDGDIDQTERRWLEELRAALAHAEERCGSVLDAFSILWRELPFSRRLVEEAESSATARLDLDSLLALSELVSEVGSSRGFSVEAFLELNDLSQGAPEDGSGASDLDAVRVVSAHASVGSEFDTVMVIGAVEGDFPSLVRPEPMFDLSSLAGTRSRAETNRARLADERRLFRMALARARRRVVLTASDPHGQESDEAVASRFVDELGLGWKQPDPGPPVEPVSVAEAAAAWRRTLGDATMPPPERLACLAGILVLGEDPGTWWFQRDWTAQGEPPRERLYLSYSRFDHLENCELQFALADDLGLDPSGGYQAWVGHLIHRLIEDVENGRIERTPEAFVEALNQRWQQGRFPSLAVCEAERAHAIDVLIPNWFARYGDLPAEATERGFGFEFDGATIKGKIDRIGPVPESGRRITDYKTGAADNAGRPSENLQLGIYYLAVDGCEDLEEFRPVDAVELAYLPGKKGKWELVPLSWDVSQREEDYKERMRNRLSGLIATVRRLDEEGSYVASTSANCFFCRFQTLCSRYPEGGEVFPIPLPEREGEGTHP
jgi:superfamily I DNA/RNA helicase